MGQTKLEKAGLFFVATDVDSGDLAFEPQPTKDIRYIIEKETIKFFNKDSKRYGAKNGYMVGLTGTVNLDTGASGSVDGISVDSVEIMSGAKATAVMSSVAANTFADGTVTINDVSSSEFATGTVTLLNALANAFATGTVTCATAVVNDTVTVNGLLYTAVSGAPAEDEFNIDTGNNETATSLAAQITADTRSGTSGDQTAISASAVVTITTDVLGVSGNAITLVSSDAGTLAVTGSGFLTGGIDADFCTINGLVYTAVAGSKAGDFTKFSIDGNDTVDALDLVDSINNDVRAGTLGDVSALSAVGVVTLTSDEAGTDGNAVTLTSSDGTTLAVSGALFTGGVDVNTVTINGLVYSAVDGTKTTFAEFTVDGTDTTNASDLAHSINNDTRSGTSGDITASNIAGVVTVVTDVAGTTGNAITLVSNSAGELAVSGSGTLTGGVVAETVIINGLTYTAVTGTPIDFTVFSIDVDDDATAASLAVAVNGDTRAGTLGDVTATSTTDTTTLTQTLGGAGGKATTLAETGSGITISGATFAAPEAFDTSLTVTATNVAANITAFTSIPNYSATASTGLITIKIETDKVAVNGFTVASEVTTITSTDVNMGVDTGNLIDSAGTEFVDLATLIIFLRASTGG